ncbi:MAG: tripartite tricarboxylate transporter permease [Patescibacteria group bacterium]
MDNLLIGINVAVTIKSFIAIGAGVLMGIFVGAMPGLNAATGVALLLPFTYGLDPSTAMILLCALYTAAEYGGSITAIAIGTPGTPAAVATTFDGYPLTKKGMPGKALGTSIIASTFGGIFSTICLIVLSVPLVKFALKFGPTEYFALGIFGLTIVSSLIGKSVIKGFIATMVGLMLNMVGDDEMTGFSRYLFGVAELFEGIPLVPVLIGLFAISEVFVIIEELSPMHRFREKISSALPTAREIRKMARVIIQSSIIGTVIGVVPGAGASVANLVAYAEAKRISKEPEKFGSGVLEGVAAPEAANNATVGGALIPLLTLGVPGSGTTAVLLGGLMLHGLIPGPQLFSRNPDVIYGLFVSLFIINFVMLFAGLLGTKLWTQVTATPKGILATLILAIAFIGSYGINNDMFGVWVMLITGLMGYLMRRFGFPVPPVVIAMVLGKMVETNLRRALLISDGSYKIFFTSPIAIGLFLLSFLSFFWPFIREHRRKKKLVMNSKHA